MKRSADVGLIAMGAFAFVGTFAAGTSYMAMRKPAVAQPQAAAAVQPQQQAAAVKPNSAPCVQRPDGSQTCTSRGGNTYVFVAGQTSAQPQPALANLKPQPQVANLTGNARTSVPSSGAIERSGFGSTAATTAHASAGG